MQDYPVVGTYLDFQKAFDAVPHWRLLKKLRSLGVSDNLLRWIDQDAFLTDRKQQASAKGHLSG